MDRVDDVQQAQDYDLSPLPSSDSAQMPQPLSALRSAGFVKEPLSMEAPISSLPSPSSASTSAFLPSSASSSSSSSSSSSAVPSSSASSPVVSPTSTRDPFPCLKNASSPDFNATACTPPTEVEEHWVVWEVHSTVAVVVGGVVFAILIAAVAFILYHRQRRRQSLQRASSGYSATSFNSSINDAAAGQDQSHANPALQHTCDVYDIDEFSLDNDSFLHTLECFEHVQRYGTANGSYGRMRGAPAIIHPSASATVAPAPMTKPPQLDPLSVLSITPPTSTVSSVGSGAVTKTLSRGDV